MALSDGVVAAYNMSGDATDSSPNSYDGTASGVTLTADKDSVSDEAYGFDGINDDIDIPSDIATDVINAGSFTVSAWVYSESGARRIIVLGNGGGTIGNAIILQINSSGDLVGFVGQNSVPSAATYTGWVHDAWHHVVMTFDGTNIRLYVDNDLKDTSGDITWVAGSSAGWIGSQGTSLWFKGKMDDLVIWDRVIGSSERAELYNSGGLNPYPFGSSASTGLQINIGDSWKEVSAMKINIGDSWKDVDGAQINIGDSWKNIF